MGCREDYLAATARTLRALDVTSVPRERRQIGEVESFGNLVRTSLVRREDRERPVVEISFFKPNREIAGEVWARGALLVGDPARLGTLIAQLEEAKRALEAAASKTPYRPMPAPAPKRGLIHRT